MNRQILNSYFGLIINLGVALVIVSTLFLFANLTTDLYDTPKFIILLIVTAALLCLVAVKFILDNKVVLLRTPLDLPLLMLLAVAIVSTFLSPAPFVSLLGNAARVHPSLASLAVYVIFYFVIINSLKLKDVKSVLYLLTGGGVLLSVLSLLSYSGIKILPNPWIQGLNFTPTGSSFSTTAILALLIPIVTSNMVAGPLTGKILNSLILTLFGVTIALTGTWATWVAAVFGFALTVALSLPITRIERIKPLDLMALGVPVVATVLVILLSFIPPLSGVANPFYSQTKNFPREVQLPFVHSWKIAISAFRDSPFWGTGSGTFLFDFTKYKPIEINSSKTLWNLRFDSGFNEYLQVLATMGGIGFLALVSLTALFISSAYSTLKASTSKGPARSADGSLNDSPGGEVSRALAVAGLTFFILLLLHSSSLVLWVIGAIILACFMITIIDSGEASSVTSASSFKETFLRIANISLRDSSAQTIRIEALPSVLLTVAVALSLFALFFGGKFVFADFHHRNALTAIAQNQGIVAYNELIAAEKLNPHSDLYRTDLAQVNFALANAIAQAKGPTEASPAGSLTDTDKQNIQTLLQQSINEGRVAVTLSPNSAINWEILALLYRQIAGVAQNALIFSLDSYGKAIFQDPLNPILRLNVGGTYYAIKNYDLAIRFFTDSINIKPDFANGYYNLSVALRDKGDLNTALAVAERMITLVDKDSPDYKVASDYLDDLKNKVAPTSPEQPPAATTSGALQNQKLPKVVDVGNPPEKIATPPAIPKPSPTPQP